MRIGIIVQAAVLSAACHTYDAADLARQPRAPRRDFRGTAASNLADGCVADFDSSRDYFPDKARIRHAAIFDVTYFRHYKVVRLKTPRTTLEGDAVRDTMVLVQCGTPPPLGGEVAKALTVTVPAMTLAANDNRDVAFLAALGLDDRLNAIGGVELYNAAVRERWLRNKLPTIGYAWHGVPNLEIVLTAPVDVLFMRRGSLDQGLALDRARRLGIAAVPTVSYNEGHYLGFSEWVKYFALFVNAEARANRLFDEVESSARATSVRARAGASRPGVIWVNHVSGGLWSAARRPDDWRSRLIADAGGTNLLTDAQALPSGEVTTEVLAARGVTARVWITEQWTTRGWPRTPTLSRIHAFRAGNVFHHQKRTLWQVGAFDWYETGAVRPDLVLRDLAALFHQDLAADDELMFFDRQRREGSAPWRN
jgi:iron complex transport system substrate-binding protein